MDIIKLKGLTFRAEVEGDSDMQAPWEEHDGHGNVRTVNASGRYGNGPDKRPGERVLWSEGRTAYLYDWQAAIRTARDEWGIGDDDRAKLSKRLRREPTAHEVAECAAQKDFDYLRAWCSGEWQWVGIVVTLLDVEGNETRETESLWGIESTDYTYHDEVAAELAEQLADRIGDADRLAGPVIRHGGAQ